MADWFPEELRAEARRANAAAAVPDAEKAGS
jgi:hypothetical protein